MDGKQRQEIYSTWQFKWGFFVKFLWTCQEFLEHCKIILNGIFSYNGILFYTILVANMPT